MTRWLALLAFLLLPSLAHAQATVVTSCGSTTLTAGTSHFVTVDTNGQSCQSGAGSGGGTTGCSQATAYLARATGETAHASDLTTLICGLVTDGVWSKLDALYVLAQQTQADARLNLVSSSYSLSAGATFTAYRGLSAFGSAGLNTGFNASLAPSPKFTLNSASMSAWAYDAPDGNAQIGTSSLTGASYIFANLAGVFYFGVNIPSTPGFVSSPANAGFYSGDRSSVAMTNFYYNGSNIQVDTTPSAVPDGVPIYIGGRSSDYGTTKTISAAHIGGSLGGAGNLALYNRLRMYMTSVGVP